MKLTKKEIKRIELVSIELKKWADNLTYEIPSAKKVQLIPSSRWRYKKEILLLCAKTKMGAKVENAFIELDQLHKEYESWRAKTLTEDNEENFRTLVDCLKDTLWELADTLNQIVQIEKEELSSETPTETEQDITPSKSRGFIAWLKNHPHSYGLTGGLIFLILLLVLGLFKAQCRQWCWGVAGLAFLVLVLSLLGGSSR